MNKRYKWALIGCSLSFLGPLGEWLFISLFNMPSSNALALSYVYTEIWTLICFMFFGFYLGKSAESIERIAFHDALTGVFTRRYLMSEFEKLFANYVRYEQSFSVLMLDLDHFKQVNDLHGHLIGDKTLIEVTHCMAETCRKIDIVGRYGGEEFIILCPNTGSEDAKQLAERIRLAVANLTEEILGFPGPQTVSIGVISTGDETVSTTAMLNSLDQALYEAKDDGRNNVKIANIHQSFAT